ncbi:hypothetical protein TSUD_176130 [Trifolium subterraneum]|uniref:F-box domain-containing protein n=1 Tax=Trifolium subterraneum TaxID=3900 RepID=A0A2Z6LPL1_TRISU|nr:hypothetical protein TSUD_176130 [Trifolium subterraneum]
MAHVSNVDDDVGSSQSLTTATKRRQLTTSVGTLTTTPPPLLHNLPFDLVADNILCRLPVKLLLQLKCVCKSWKYLISDPKFAKKHLRFSTKLQRYHIMVNSTLDLKKFLVYDSIISSIFSTSSSVTQTQRICPVGFNPSDFSTCDGIICFPIDTTSAVLWNPSIRKLKILPPLIPAFDERLYCCAYTFGYDHFIDNYKIIGISLYINKKEVSVNTLGTDYWRRIEDFPCSGSIQGKGTFVSGTVNWLAVDDSCDYAIVSLDLEKESYQYLPLPYHNKVGNNFWSLEVVKDCLCIFANMDMSLDVLIMKEYGKKESWTKLYNVPYLGLYFHSKALYISEYDQLLMGFYEPGSSIYKLVVYDSKKCTMKIPNIQNISRRLAVYLESLISPCS